MRPAQEGEPKVKADWKQRTAETVVLMSRVKSANSIEVEIKSDEMDSIQKERKAIYAN